MSVKVRRYKRGGWEVEQYRVDNRRGGRIGLWGRESSISSCQRFGYGGVTDSTGLNRGGEACRVPSSRKTIGNNNCQHAVCIRCLVN